MSTLKRGELAKATGTNIETIRYYEKTGLIPEAERNETKRGTGYFLKKPSELYDL